MLSRDIYRGRYRPELLGGHAARRYGRLALHSAAAQSCSNVSFITKVWTLSSRWAPRGDHRICCALHHALRRRRRNRQLLATRCCIVDDERGSARHVGLQSPQQVCHLDLPSWPARRSPRDKLLVDQRMHRGSGRAHRVALGFEAARQVVRDLVLNRPTVSDACCRAVHAHMVPS